MVRQELAAFEATVKLTGLELAFMKLVFGKVTGTVTSIRKEADELFFGTKKVLAENYFPYEYEDLKRILKVQRDFPYHCEPLPERM